VGETAVDKTSASTAILIIAADDYGYWPSYNEGILEAIRRGVVDSVGALVERDHCDPAPLLETGIEIGLHLEFEGRWGKRSRNAAKRSLDVQLDRFTRFFHSWPAYLDGHHHCHARPELIEPVATIAKQIRVPVRSVNERHRQLLRERGIPTQDHLIGRVSPQEEHPDSALRSLDPGVTIWFLHPGYPDPDSGSSYDGAREADLDLLLRLSLLQRTGQPAWGKARRSTHTEALTHRTNHEGPKP
jgi:predicted glycoside hydrolase/deacetylase ChbG (UPF0249 family)